MQGYTNINCVVEYADKP